MSLTRREKPVSGSIFAILAVKIQEITVEALHELFSPNNTNNNNANYLLIDVREQTEHEVAAIKTPTTLPQILVPLSVIDSSPAQAHTIINAQLKVEAADQFIIYCRSGHRSAKATEILQGLFPHINMQSLAGGINAWEAMYPDEINRHQIDCDNLHSTLRNLRLK